VANLHGVIVPIVDMRIRFSLGSSAYDRVPVAIINIPDRIIGIGTLDDRRLILVDTDNLMAPARKWH
jgi:chemotaxis signal transduction protein